MSAQAAGMGTNQAFNLFTILKKDQGWCSKNAVMIHHNLVLIDIQARKAHSSSELDTEPLVNRRESAARWTPIRRKINYCNQGSAQYIARKTLVSDMYEISLANPLYFRTHIDILFFNAQTECLYRTFICLKQHRWLTMGA
jgi:hypothetical protein